MSDARELAPEPPVAAFTGSFPRSRRVATLPSRSWLLWHALLWLLLATLSGGALLTPELPVGGRNALLAVSLGTTAGVVGLSVLLLGTFRFIVIGRLHDLLVGFGFGVLAVVDLAVGVCGTVWALDALAPPTSAYLLLGGRAGAAVLFLVALLGAFQPVSRIHRRRIAWQVGFGVLSLALVGLLGAISSRARLVDPIDPRARELVAAGVPVFGVLPGQSDALVVANAVIAAMLLVAAIGHLALSRRIDDPQLNWVAAALALLFFTQLQAFLFPPVSAQYVSTADIPREGAYALLLFSLIARLSGEIAEHASRDERLRLSRELHDGLAQQLGLLNLRLSRAAIPGRSPDARAHDLETARCLVEAASLEARQAITALRTGTIAWGDFVRTVGTFGDEFGQNHEVDVRVKAEGIVPMIEAELQAEVLRIMQEALSNAVRHGHAAHLDLEVVAGPRELQVVIRDDGTGFDASRALSSNGLGLRSMSEHIERRGGALSLSSRANGGATVEVRLPLGRA